jgi:hypothetical protein
MYPKADFKCNLPEFWDWILLFYLFGGSAYRNSGLKPSINQKHSTSVFQKKTLAVTKFPKYLTRRKTQGLADSWTSQVRIVIAWKYCLL